VARSNQAWTAVLALICILGCGRGNRAAHVDQSEFTGYINRFEETGKRLGKDLRGSAHSIPITFGSTREESAYGECRWHLLYGNRIIINEERWHSLDELTKQSLIFHELGHCMLGRHHDDSEIIVKHSDREGEETFPKSLMNTVLVNGRVFESHREHYERELFGK